MVKVQKPTPKTLSILGTIDNPIKKKKLDLKKETKSKASAVLVPDVAPPSKKEKAKKLEGNVIEEKVAQKFEKKQNNKASEEKVAAEPKKPAKEKKGKNRPLILAPPDSPIPVPAAPEPTPTIAGGKNKKAKAQKAGAAPLSAFEKRNKKKQQKSNKPADDASKSKPQANGPKQQPKELTKAQKKRAAVKAYKKQQKKKGGKKEKPIREHTLQPVPYDEEKFKAILNVANIKKIASALKVQCEKEVAEKKTSIFSDYRYFLNLVCFKIANCPKRMVKLSVKHPLVDKDDDVVIIVRDLQRGAKVDYEPTTQHYEDIFREAGVEGLKIVPFNQLKNECNSFEAVRKFGNTYDYFLCDGRFVGHVAGFTGKIFQKPRTTFHAVRLDNPKTIKNEIEKSLRRTAYKQLSKGDLISIPVGTHKFTAQQLAENVDHLIGQLKTVYPGGLGNIRSMNLKIDIVGTSSLPLYISMAQPPAETPYVVGEREQRMKKMKKEANEVLSKFAMLKDAQIIKLSKDQVEQKRKIKETKAALAAKIETPEENGDDDDDDKTSLPAKKAKKEQKVEAPQDDDDDGEVPAKKAKKEQKAEVEKDSKKKHVEEQAEPDEEGDDEDAENDSDDEEGDDDDDDGDDDDDVDDDDDDDGEGNGDVDEDGDDDDDDDDDDDEDEADDDEDGDDNEDSD